MVNKMPKWNEIRGWDFLHVGPSGQWSELNLFSHFGQAELKLKTIYVNAMVHITLE